MDKNFKRTILIDLDGVLNEYKGNYDKNFIPPLKEGAKDFLEYLSQDYEIKIFTSRNKFLAAKWLMENGFGSIIEDITNIKEPCWLYVDDRCLKFEGDFEELKRKIENFKVWYKD